jgi:hypothetical protein
MVEAKETKPKAVVLHLADGSEARLWFRYRVVPLHVRELVYEQEVTEAYIEFTSDEITYYGYVTRYYKDHPNRVLARQLALKDAMTMGVNHASLEQRSMVWRALAVQRPIRLTWPERVV